MKYVFTASMIIERIRVQRKEKERQAEAGYCFSHHGHPMRGINDILTIKAEINLPKGCTDDQVKAIETALDSMVARLRSEIQFELDDLEEQQQRSRKHG